VARAGTRGGGELKKLEQTTINKRICIKIEVCVREGKVMTINSNLKSHCKLIAGQIKAVTKLKYSD